MAETGSKGGTTQQASTQSQAPPAQPPEEAPRAEPRTRVLQATQSFVCEINGDRYVVHEGTTRISADHELARRYASSFKPVEDNLSFREETATDDPGARRGR